MTRANLETFIVFSIVFAALAAFYSIGLLIKTFSPNESPSMKNYDDRVKAWFVIVSLFAGVAFAGKAAMMFAFAAISFYSLREFATLTPSKQADRHAVAIAFYVVIPLQYLLIGKGLYGIFSIFIPVYVFLALPSITALKGDPVDFLERTAKLQWGVMASVYCISYVPAILTLDVKGFEGKNMLLLLWLLITVQLSDVFQYVFGKLFGKTKLAPTVSPSKTAEGLVGGLVAATFVGVAAHALTPYSPLQSAGMAFVVNVAGFFGGLSLSAIKRGLGVKDWGNSIKGHGGFLDRVDSVIFSAPLLFHLTRYFFT